MWRLWQSLLISKASIMGRPQVIHQLCRGSPTGQGGRISPEMYFSELEIAPYSESGRVVSR
jgi:hypothetical protein